VTTRAQKITTPQGFDPNFRKYSDFTINLDVHPDTGDAFAYTNVNAVKKALRNLVLTDKYERLPTAMLPTCLGTKLPISKTG
jgi:hypothetical protein